MLAVLAFLRKLTLSGDLDGARLDPVRCRLRRLRRLEGCAAWHPSQRHECAGEGHGGGDEDGVVHGLDVALAGGRGEGLAGLVPAGAWRRPGSRRVPGPPRSGRGHQRRCRRDGCCSRRTGCCRGSATPRAPPIWRVVSLTAEPTPAFAGGSEPMIDVGGRRHRHAHADAQQHEHDRDDGRSRRRPSSVDNSEQGAATTSTGRRRRRAWCRTARRASHGSGRGDDQAVRDGQEPHPGLQRRRSRARTAGTG